MVFPKVPVTAAPPPHSGGGMGILTSDLVCEVSRDLDRRSRDDRRSRERRSCSRSALRDIGPLLISSFTPLQMHATMRTQLPRLSHHPVFAEV